MAATAKVGGVGVPRRCLPGLQVKVGRAANGATRDGVGTVSAGAAGAWVGAAVDFYWQRREGKDASRLVLQRRGMAQIAPCGH